MFPDIGLPGMSGYEVAEAPRTDAYCTRAVFLAPTGWGTDEDRRRSREAGFDHHLTKPVEPHTLDGLFAAIGAGRE